MSVTGVVTSVSPKRSGDTLAADTAATDTVLLVDDAGDFDETFEVPRFLVIGDESTPRQYVAVVNDEEAQQSVTLASPVGAVLEAGLPVTLWDPESEAADKRAVTYQAWVRQEGQEPTPATIPHGLVPLGKEYALAGASVGIEQDDDGEWHVAQVFGREPTVTDVDIIGSRFLTAESGPRAVLMQNVGGNGGALLLYTGSAVEAEFAPAFLSAAETDLGGGSYILSTGLTAPQLDGAARTARLSLYSQLNSDATTETIAGIGADKLILDGDRVESPNLYLTDPPETSSVANANINGITGQLRRVTSSRRYKQDEESAPDHADAVLGMQGKTWRDRSEVADDPEVEQRYVGYIAEDLHDLGLSEYVAYNAGGEPDAIAYDRLTVPLVQLAQRQQRQIDALARRLDALEG